MSKEKEYQFVECLGFEHGKPIEVIKTIKESQLEENHTRLLLGNLIKTFEGSPEKVKDKFLNLVFQQMEEAYIHRLNEGTSE